MRISTASSFDTGVDTLGNATGTISGIPGDPITFILRRAGKVPYSGFETRWTKR